MAKLSACEALKSQSVRLAHQASILRLLRKVTEGNPHNALLDPLLSERFNAAEGLDEDTMRCIDQKTCATTMMVMNQPLLSTSPRR